MRRIVVLIAFFPVAALAGQDLDKAEDLLKHMQYRKALKAVEQVLASPDSGPEELAAAYRIQALSLAATNRKDKAVMAFRKLLAIDPGFRLPKKVSPKLRSPYFQAAGMARDQKPIRVSHEPPEVTGKLGGLKLRARLEADPLKMVKGVRFRYRTTSEKIKEIAVLVQGPKNISIKLPDGFKADKFTYWVEAFNKSGGVLARSGSHEEPFRLVAKKAPAPKPVVAKAGQPDLEPGIGNSSNGLPADETPDDAGSRATPWYKTWWFWTITGVVVAGAVTGGVVGATSGGSADPLHYEIEIQ